jgi:hypothetical protein
MQWDLKISPIFPSLRYCCPRSSPGYLNLLQTQFHWNTCAADSPLFTQYLRPERGGANRAVRKSALNVRVVNCVMYTRESSWSPHSKTRETDHPQHDRPAACYRPTVFFQRLHFTVFRFPKEKFGSLFKDILYIYLNCVQLKIRNLQSCM